MNRMPIEKYQAFRNPDPETAMVGRTITKAPICARRPARRHQALVDPMDSPRKHRMSGTLVEMGFMRSSRLPAASDTDFNFVREIIEQGPDSDDVSIQVLTQAREELIQRPSRA